MALFTTKTSWLGPPGSALASHRRKFFAPTPAPTARPAFASHSTLSTRTTFAPSSVLAAWLAFTSCSALGSRFATTFATTSATTSTTACAPGHMPLERRVWSDWFFQDISWFKGFSQVVCHVPFEIVWERLVSCNASQEFLTSLFTETITMYEFQATANTEIASLFQLNLLQNN